MKFNNWCIHASAAAVVFNKNILLLLFLSFAIPEMPTSEKKKNLGDRQFFFLDP